MPRHNLPKVMDCGPAEQQLRIAVVYSRIPFPMMRGDQMTVAHLLSFLSARGHDVDLYTMPLDGEMDDEQSTWLHGACRNVFMFPHSILAKLTGILFGLLRLTPLQIGMFANRKLKRFLREAIADDRYDIVYCYYARTASAVPDLTTTSGGPRTFLALQLSQTLNTRRMARYERAAWKRLVYRLETVLMGRFEARIWRRFHSVVLIGPADVEAIQEQCRDRGLPEMDNWIYGAHGTDTDKYQPATPSEIVANRVVFSGSMLYPPNIQAVLWFVEKAWPMVREQAPDATLVVQGRDPAPAIVELDGRDGIHVTGTVPDVGEMIRSAHVCVNPMLAAGGMQNKLIEYLASGKAVVASTVANEGIMAPADVIRIADDPESFASEVLALLSDPAAALDLGSRAREYALSSWTWEKHFLDLESAFGMAVSSRSSVSA